MLRNVQVRKYVFCFSPCFRNRATLGAAFCHNGTLFRVCVSYECVVCISGCSGQFAIQVHDQGVRVVRYSADAGTVEHVCIFVCVSKLNIMMIRMEAGG